MSNCQIVCFLLFKVLFSSTFLYSFSITAYALNQCKQEKTFRVLDMLINFYSILHLHMYISIFIQYYCICIEPMQARKKYPDFA